MIESGKTPGRAAGIIPILIAVCMAAFAHYAHGQDYRNDVVMRREFGQSQTTFIPDPVSRTQKPFDSSMSALIERVGTGDDGADSMEMAVLNFRVNRTEIDLGYMDNALALGVLDRTFQRRDILAGIDYIFITAGASPEGGKAANQKLAADRALAVKSYLLSRYPFLDRDMIYTFSVGEDWAGLRRLVEQDRNTPDREEVLSLLDSDRDDESRKAALATIGGGRAYAYIARNMLPRLRGGVALALYHKSTPPQPRIVEIVRTDTVYVEKTLETPAPKSPAKPYYIAIKNNMLYDLALLPNLAVEFSLPRRWSIEAEGMWSWWGPVGSKHLYHRIQAGGLEVRKWLGRRGRTPLTGHFIGVYGYYGNYDIRPGETGFQDPDGSFSAGLTYGYSTPVGRRLNLEFTIGVGWFGGYYHTYSYDGHFDRYPWISTRRLNWFGPTKAKVSLVWLVGSGKNEKKR